MEYGIRNMKYIKKNNKSCCPYSPPAPRLRRAGIFHIPSRRGFTILFAVLIGSLLFSLGLFIARVSLKEITLATAGKNSEVAFFAADTGIECALYYDFRVSGTFPNSSGKSMPPSINCNGAPNPLLPESANSTSATSTFTLNFTVGAKPAGCAIVLIGKTTSGSTIIESRGRNECGPQENPARVERALRVRY